MLKYLPLLIIVLGVDLLTYPIINYWIEGLPSLWQTVFTVVHYLVPLALFILLYGNDRFHWRKMNRARFVNIYSTFQLIYICKAISLMILGIFGLFNLGIDILKFMDFDLENYGSGRYFIASIAAAVPFILLPYGILVNRHRYQVRNVDVPIENLPETLEGLRIVQISDIHSGSFFDPKGFAKGVAMINDLKPDLIFFTGDLVNNRAVEFLPFVETFSGLKSTFGVYSVLGNHDYGDYVHWKSREAKIKNLQQLIDIQRSLGWKLLLNEHDVVEIGQAKVAVIGVENYSAKLRFPKYGDLAKAISEMGTVDLQLLLSHDPSHWQNQIVTDYKHIDITFSGHTHGMQFGIEIGGWQWSPIKYVYEEWAGLYTSGKQFLYVNRGFGVLGYPGRLGILPEITMMTISRA